MLRDESSAKPFDGPLSNVRRLLTVFGLVGLTVGVVTLRGPVRGDDDGRSPAAKTTIEPTQPRHPANSFETPYVREGKDGVFMIRPAKALHHNGVDPLLALLQRELDELFCMAANELKVDISQPGFLKVRCREIEWFTAGIGFDQSPQRPQRTSIVARAALATSRCTGSCSALRRSGWLRRSTGWRSCANGDFNMKRSVQTAARTTGSQVSLRNIWDETRVSSCPTTGRSSSMRRM
jgi:hypothetical protein